MPFFTLLEHQNIHQDGVFYAYMTMVAENERATAACATEIKCIADDVFRRLHREGEGHLPHGADIRMRISGCEAEITLAYVSGEAVQAVFEALLAKKESYFTPATCYDSHVIQSLMNQAQEAVKKRHLM